VIAKHLRLLSLLLLAGPLVHPSGAAAQQTVSATERTVAGCWALSAGAFKPATKIGVDSGMTNLPMRVQLDMAPGVGILGEQRNRLLRALPDSNASQYRDGWYRSASQDRVQLEWSNGFVWLSIDAVLKGDELRGTAKAGTDYGGEERADVILRRIPCPAA
jgi:hypothetical protein